METPNQKTESAHITRMEAIRETNPRTAWNWGVDLSFMAAAGYINKYNPGLSYTWSFASVGSIYGLNRKLTAQHVDSELSALLEWSTKFIKLITNRGIDDINSKVSTSMRDTKLSQMISDVKAINGWIIPTSFFPFWNRYRDPETARSHIGVAGLVSGVAFISFLYVLCDQNFSNEPQQSYPKFEQSAVATLVITILTCYHMHLTLLQSNTNREKDYQVTISNLSKLHPNYLDITKAEIEKKIKILDSPHSATLEKKLLKPISNLQDQLRAMKVTKDQGTVTDHSRPPVQRPKGPNTQPPSLRFTSR